MSVARAFRLLGETDHTVFQQTFGRIADDWSREWFAASPVVLFEPDSAAPDVLPDAEEWVVIGRPPECWVAWHLREGAWRDLARWLFNGAPGPSAKPGPLAEAVLRDCLCDLSARVLTDAGFTELWESVSIQAGSSLRVGYGSGAVFGSLAGDLPRQPLAFGGALVEAIVSTQRTLPALLPAPALVKREASIRNGRTGIEIILGEAELSLAELATISVGDVIRLDALHRHPLRMQTRDGQLVGHIELGTRGEHKAAQFTFR